MTKEEEKKKLQLDVDKLKKEYRTVGISFESTQKLIVKEESRLEGLQKSYLKIKEDMDIERKALDKEREAFSASSTTKLLEIRALSDKETAFIKALNDSKQRKMDEVVLILAKLEKQFLESAKKLELLKIEEEKFVETKTLLLEKESKLLKEIKEEKASLDSEKLYISVRSNEIKKELKELKLLTAQQKKNKDETDISTKKYEVLMIEFIQKEKHLTDIAHNMKERREILEAKELELKEKEEKLKAKASELDSKDWKLRKKDVDMKVEREKLTILRKEHNFKD